MKHQEAASSLVDNCTSSATTLSSSRIPQCQQQVRIRGRESHSQPSCSLGIVSNIGVPFVYQRASSMCTHGGPWTPGANSGHVRLGTTPAFSSLEVQYEHTVYFLFYCTLFAEKHGDTTEGLRSVSFHSMATTTSNPVRQAGQAVKRYSVKFLLFSRPRFNNYDGRRTTCGIELSCT